MRRPHRRASRSSDIAKTSSYARRLERSISSSRSTSDLGPGNVACGERVDRHADHLLGAPAHLLEGLDQLRVARQVLGQLDQLGDRHAVVGHPLEVEIRVQDREHEPQVDGDRRLPREQLLDSLLDLEIALVDLVVEAR